MVCILHIANRLDICVWRVSLPEHKDSMESTKKRIQTCFREELGLTIDITKQGADTSNDGNTAWRFFENPQLTSEITQVNVDLIHRFSIILQVLSCNSKINVKKFEVYAFETAELFVKLYGWYYKPVGVHKILLHGSIALVCLTETQLLLLLVCLKI